MPIALTDTVLRCAQRGLFRPLWSTRILLEARRAVQRIHPYLPPARVDYRFANMSSAFPEADVRGYEEIIERVFLPDADDRHVVAAAYKASADLIVTNNLKDFPAEELSKFALEAVGVDSFLRDMLDLYPDDLEWVIARQARSTSNPPLTDADVLESLARAGAPGFVHDYQCLRL
ncbi:MAG: PIN domain-containing protein [Actinomycetia bacterium]|nr:PIN domain-containing protein [Actinomycetes bacterium]